MLGGSYVLLLNAVHGVDLYRDGQFAVHVTENVEYGTGVVVENLKGGPHVS